MAMQPGDMEPGDRLKTVAIGAMSAAKTAGQQAGEQPTPTLVDMPTVEAIIAGWPKMSQAGAREIIEKYGAPNEAMDSRLIWYNNGPWKRTIASRTLTMHHFPAPHPDSVEQVIDYRVPLGKYDDLARYDGSVNVDRTKGELSARCDLEEMNLLALNLAHDVITGKKSVTEARGFYARVVKMFKEQKTVHPYQMRLMIRCRRA